VKYKEILEACWTGYTQQGMKKKGNRQVPNCVPVSEESMEEDLKKWFKEKWVRFGPDGKIRGDCARGSEGEGKPKCLPQAKAHALGKKGRASAAAKKRREDPNPERRGPAKNVATKVKEQYTDDDDWYDDEDQETELRSGDYVRDQMDGEHGEIFRMQGDPYERRVRILDRDGKGWYIEPGRLTRVDPTDPDIQRYFGKRRQRDMDESVNPKLDAIVKNIQARVPKATVQRPEIMKRIAQMVQQADPTIQDAMATAQQLVQQYGQSPAPAQTNVNDIKAQARSGNLMAQLPKTSAGTPTYAQQHSTFEGYQDFNKVEPYEVCLAGKPVKTFDYYEDARRFHDNWKKKLYREGNKAKADKITLNPVMKEGWYDPRSFPGAKIGPHIAGPQRTPVPQVKNQIIKLLMATDKDLINKYGQRDVNIVAQSEASKAEPTPQGIRKAVNNVINFLTSGSSVNRLRQQTLEGEGVEEAANPAQQAAIAIAMKRAGKKPKQVDEDTGSWIVYDPKTKQIKKRFKTHTAGKSYAKAHGLGFASSEYYFDTVKEKDVTEGSSILAALKQVDEEQDACYRKVKSRYKVWPSAYASGALVQCRKKGAANWGNKGKKK